MTRQSFLFQAIFFPMILTTLMVLWGQEVQAQPAVFFQDDFEDGNVSDWTGGYYSGQLDLDGKLGTTPYFAAAADAAASGNYGLRYTKDQGAYSYTACLSSPAFGPLTGRFQIDFDIVLEQQGGFTVFLGESAPHATHNEQEATTLGIQFGEGIIYARTSGSIGGYTADTFIHVMLVVDYPSRRFDATLTGTLYDTDGHPVSHITATELPFESSAVVAGITRINLTSGGWVPPVWTMGMDNLVIGPEVLPVAVSTPELTATYEEALAVPVSVSETTGRDIVSAEVFVAYDGDLLAPAATPVTSTTMTTDWTVEYNIGEGNGTPVDTLKIAMADEAPLSGSGDLVELHFEVADIRRPAYSPLELTHVLLNDGTPENTATDGSVTLVGVDGTIASDPDTVLPRWSIAVMVEDVDEDRDAMNPDAFEVAATNGTQTETVTVTETGASTGIFAGNIATAFSLSFTSDDGIVQAKAGDAIEFCYDDSLDSGGVTQQRCATTAVIGGHDSSIRTTVVSQPGDTVRVRVIDADLSASVAVDVENPRTGEVESILLSQFASGDSSFYGRFFTDLQAGVVGDSTLKVAKGDTLVVTYADTLTAQGGMAIWTDDDEVVDPFGDAHPNGSVQAFDAAWVLMHRLSTYGGGAGNLSGLDSLSANVDSLAPFGIIDGYDASLILQKVVGLVERFQVQAPNAANHPQPETRTRPKAQPETRELALRMEEGYVSVWAEDRGGIVSGELQVEGIAGAVAMGEELGDFLVISETRGKGMQVVFAGAQGVSGPGELLRIYSGVGPGSVQLTRATFNGGRIGAQVTESGRTVRPLSYVLYANAPNPFNPETVIRYALPVASEVELTVYDVVGQRVKGLVSGMHAAGMYEVVWDGRNNAGAPVSSGVYFYRLEARGETSAFQQMRRMMLLK